MGIFMPRKVEVESVAKRRSEVVTVRLDPRLKYLAEIAARKQRRTLSGYIEWAVEQSLHNVFLEEANSFSQEATSVSTAEQRLSLWDVEESDRVIKLAMHFPELLTYEEQLVWKLVRGCGYLWRGHFSKSNGDWEWTISGENLIWDRLRAHWQTFRDVAEGDLPKEQLPTWVKNKAPQSSPSARTNALHIDDDIPF
jgi:hypothetical protein